MARAGTTDGVAIPLTTLDKICDQVGRLASQPVIVSGTKRVVERSYDVLRSALDAGHSPESILEAFKAEGCVLDWGAVERAMRAVERERRRNKPLAGATRGAAQEEGHGRAGS
ncbi:hypothetical protein EPN42_10890 [bacterium]|nr:MAG: hypothetical protein EPN42_10890 [bacterium]